MPVIKMARGGRGWDYLAARHNPLCTGEPVARPQTKGKLTLTTQLMRHLVPAQLILESAQFSRLIDLHCSRLSSEDFSRDI